MNLKGTFVVAEMTFQEAIRKRFIIFILLISSFFLLLNLSCEGAINVNGQERSLMRFSAFFFFYMVGIWNLGISTQITSSLVTEELENKTYIILLSKPISKLNYYLGKAFGIFFIIIANTFLVYFIYSISIYIKMGFFFFDFWKSFFPMLLGYALIISIVLLLSLATNKTVSVMIMSGLIVFSFIINGILYETNVEKFFEPAKKIHATLKIFYWVLPQFGSLTFFSSSLFESSISQVHYLGELSVYQISMWICIIWLILYFYLDRREFSE